MKKARVFGLYTLIGAVSYWATDLLIHWAVPQGLLWIVLLTVLLPAIVSLVYFLLLRRHPHSQHPLGLPLFMLLGIWVFGPWATTVSSGFSSGDVLVMVVLFPILTLVLAADTGSLGGLLITSCLLPIYSIVAETRHKASGGSPLPSTSEDPKLDLMDVLSGWKFIVVSLVLGVGITASVLSVDWIWAESRTAMILLWPFFLIVRLFPRRNVGTDENSFYDDSTVDLFGLMFGLTLSAVFNGSVVYLVLKVTKTFRSSADQDN